MGFDQNQNEYCAKKGTLYLFVSILISLFIYSWRFFSDIILHKLNLLLFPTGGVFGFIWHSI